MPTSGGIFVYVSVCCVSSAVICGYICNLTVASFRGGGSADPPRIVKCKSFALSVSSKPQKAVCTLVIMVDNTGTCQ